MSPVEAPYCIAETVLSSVQIQHLIAEHGL